LSDLFIRKLEKDGQNRERLLNDKARAEEELKNTLIAHSNVLNVWAKSKAEHETEMKVLEQREELLRVRSFLLFSIKY
jgi:hypothetical protein